jgi:hypothetical protein
MLAKVAEILLDKFLKPRTSEQKADSDVKKKIVFLHESLIHCHNAYSQYKSDPSDENHAVWRHAVVYLIRVLEEIRTTLAAFAPDAFDEVYEYAAAEAPIIPPGGDYTSETKHSKSRAKRDECTELNKTITELKGLKKRKNPPKGVGYDFEKAVTKLREFMGNHMTMGEIHRAQKDFKSEIAP